jgi:predicted NBD/HSP70 family sugar kinase
MFQTNRLDDRVNFDSPSASVARQISVRSVIEAVLHQGPISRADIARVTGLSKQTTSEVVRALERNGWIRMRGQKQGAVGRSAITYEIQNDTAFVLGIDLGGTKLHMALANLSGAVMSEINEPTDPRGGRHVVEQIGHLKERLVAAAGIAASAVRLGVMGSPGVMDARSGAITFAPNIPGFDAINVGEALKARLGLEIFVENDVNLAAKGEQWQGKSRRTRTFAFIALGTGIGMGIVADGRLMRGWRGAAGEIAYLPLGSDPFDPRNFHAGTLESAVGSAAIVQRYRGYGGRPNATVRDIFEMLGNQDKAAVATIEETARILVAAIAAVGAIVDPEMIVMGGSIGARPELVGEIRRLLPRCTASPVPVEISALGSRATLVGALGVALNHLHNSLFGLMALPGDLPLPGVDFDGTADAVP